MHFSSKTKIYMFNFQEMPFCARVELSSPVKVNNTTVIINANTCSDFRVQFSTVCGDPDENFEDENGTMVLLELMFDCEHNHLQVYDRGYSNTGYPRRLITRRYVNLSMGSKESKWNMLQIWFPASNVVELVSFYE